MTVFILGGAQTDFAVHHSRAGRGLYDLMAEAVRGALADAGVEPGEIEAGHVGNFTGELFAGQGHLGGMFAAIDPAFAGRPASRHEAACASGSMAVMAAIADLVAGHYGCVCVVGVEQMRNVPGQTAADHLGAAAWRGREAAEARYVWPHLFDRITLAYDRRYGLRHEHLARIAAINFGNARTNPNAQTRNWSFPDGCFSEDDALNPPVEGRVRRHDCAQITDGAAALVLAGPRFAAEVAQRRGLGAGDLPTIAGWGHRTAPLALADKLEAAPPGGLLFPHVREAIRDAQRRARLPGSAALDAIELHDCFTITEYLLIDHFELTAPGEAWRAIEEGVIARDGRLPINPSGGLIGGGHPVGASGVRMVLDGARQVTGRAAGYQVPGARAVQTLNIGGSATTVASFVVRAGHAG